MLIARFSPQTFALFLSERFASEFARSSAATASTPCVSSSASCRLRRYATGAPVLDDEVTIVSDMGGIRYTSVIPSVSEGPGWREAGLPTPRSLAPARDD